MSPDAAAGVQRRHDLPGVYNLRDTGGYRAGARASRWGKLFRSDALHRVDDAGRRRLSELGITQVVDLRGDDELSTAPSLIRGIGVTVHHLPVLAAAAPAAQVVTRLELRALYDHVIDERGEALASAIRVIADADHDDAVLVHCTAGKDRTGLVIALALASAGVDRDEVVADYAATADNLRGEWATATLQSIAGAGHDLTPAVVELITESPAPVMDALLDRIDREHGSTADYLRSRGMTDAELDRLASALVD